MKKESVFIKFSGKKEFKKINKRVGNAIVALLNTNGGTITINLKERLGKKSTKKIQEIINEIEPAIKLNLEYNGTHVILNIPKGLDKPYCNHQGFFSIQKEEVHLLGRDELLKFINDEGLVATDKRIFKNLPVQDFFFPKAFNEYLERGRHIVEADFYKQLERLKALINHQGTYYFTLGGLLCFTERPQLILDNAFVVINKFGGTNKASPIESKEFQGPFFEMYDRTFDHLKKELKFLPEVIIKELLVNMLIHNDYTRNLSPMKIEIYTDRIIFSNLQAVKKLAEKDIEQNALCVNSDLRTILKDIEYFRNTGSGLEIINQELKRINYPMLYFEKDDFFKVRISLKKSDLKPKTPQARGFMAKAFEQGSKYEIKKKQIYEKIVENPSLTQSELSVKTDISERTISRIIQELRDSKQIIRVGAKKNGYWEIQKQ